MNLHIIGRYKYTSGEAEKPVKEAFNIITETARAKKVNLFR